MNVLYVSSDASEEAALRRELEPFSPAPAIHPSPGIEDARTRMAVAGAFDALLIDGSIPRPEAAFMAEGLKREGNPAVIVVLTPETGDEAAETLLGECVDLFVPKLPGFGAVLHQALLQAAARRSPAPHQARQVRILYAGELEPFRRHFADMPSLMIHPLPQATDGPPQTGDAAGDLVVIDCPGESAAAAKAITDAVRDYPRIPVIALTEPGDEAAAIAALNAGAADSIPRTGQFPRRLLAAVEKAVRMGRLAREKEALKKQGERLRLIVETVPVGVALIAPDGSFLAVNRTGLERIGAHRSDQIIGKNLLHLVPPQEREAVQKFLATVGAWSSASISLKWKGIDGSIPGVDLRAIPLRRSPGSAASVLATLHPPRSLEGDAGVEAGILKKYEDLTTMLRTYEVRFRELQEKSRFKFTRWETALRLAESQKKASEQQQARLQAAVEEAEARVRHLEEEHDAQRERWEQSQRESRERSERLEAVAAELEASRAQMSVIQGDGQGLLEEERRDIERRQAEADAALAEVSDLLEKEKAQHRQQREELEQRLREAERHQSDLEAALEETGARLQRQDEALRAELAAAGESRTGLERKLEETLAERASLEESLRAELAAAGESRAGLERRLDETLAERASLEESLRAELAAAGETRTELERKLEETLAERASLEESLRAELAARDESRDDLRLRIEETEARLRGQEEEYRAELVSRDESRAELERKLEETLAERAALEESLRAELAAAGASRAELERKLEETLAERAVLEESLRAELAAAGESRTGLERKLEETLAKRTALEESLRAELAAAGETRTGLERKLEETLAERASLEESLRAELAARDESRDDLRLRIEETEARLRGQEEEYRAELVSRDESRAELERKLEETLAERAALEESLRAELAAAGESRTELERKLEETRAELAARDESRDDLRRRLEETEARLRRQEEEYRAELAAREESRAGLQRKLQETENSWLALEAALEETEARLAGLTAAHGQLQELHRGADDTRASLESALRMQGARYAALCERSGADRAWQQLAAMELERKHLAAEEQRAPLEAALRDAEARIRELTEKYIAERREQERREEELREHHQAAKARIRDLEARYAEAESLLEARQRELGEAAARLAALGEQHASERARLTAELAEFDRKFQAAEKQRISLQTALADSESRAAAMKERHDAEQERLGIERGDLELRIREGEKQLAGLQTALAGAQSALSQLAEKHRTEISQYEFAQKKAEQKFQTAEKQRGTLAESLQEVETRLADLTGRYQTEQAAWQSARAEMERRLEEGEKAHAAAVQNTVREAEARLAWISEQNQSKAVQLEQAQKRLEELQSENRTLAREGSHCRRGYQRLSRFTPAGIVRATRGGQVVECNDIVARMFGYPNAQAALSRPDGSPFRIYAFEGALAARLDEEGSLEGIEWTALGKEGKPVRVRENAALVEASDGETPLVERILTDISDAHGLGEEIRRIQSAGDLAAATVTSFRELCASLAEAGERLLQAAGDAEEVRRLADSLARDAGRGIRHAGQFLSLARRDDRSPDLLDFNEILTGNDRLLHSLIGTDIELEMDLAPRPGLVWADRNEVTQLIGNLMANAREALPLGGLVTIETRNVEVAGPDPEIPPELRPGIYVRLVFSTDGCAVQPERRHSSIRAIAARMGGCLKSTNDPRTGNIHTVYIPRVEGAIAGAGREAGSVGA